MLSLPRAFHILHITAGRQTISYLLTIPINALVSGLVVVGSGGIAKLAPLAAIFLIVGSMALTLLAGFFPSRVAAKKDPVVALRTE